jgi:hypothetical protein
MGNTSRLQNRFELTRTHDRIDFRDLLANLVAKALHQAACNHEFLYSARRFPPCHIEDRVNRFPLRPINERTRVNDDYICVLGLGGKFYARLRQQAHHDLAVYEVFRAAEAYESDPGGLRRRFIGIRLLGSFYG